MQMNMSGKMSFAPVFWVGQRVSTDYLPARMTYDSRTKLLHHPSIGIFLRDRVRCWEACDSSWGKAEPWVIAGMTEHKNKVHMRI